MPKNNSTERKTWRKNRADERESFGTIKQYMAKQAVAVTDDRSKFESVMKYKIAVGQAFKKIADKNPMWREPEDRRWSTEPRP